MFIFIKQFFIREEKFILNRKIFYYDSYREEFLLDSHCHSKTKNYLQILDLDPIF
jgi:hypothetical protein